MRRFRLALLASVLSAGCALAAHADNFNYQFENTNGQLTGNIVVDSNDNPVGGSFTFNDGQNTYTFNAVTDFDRSGTTTPTGNYGYLDFVNTAGDSAYILVLLTPPSSISTYYLCSTSNPCSYGTNFVDSIVTHVTPNSGDEFDIASGDASISVVASTPEPSSIALLGTGILGIAGAARRRFRA